MLVQVYLAGPDVFLPDPTRRAEAMKRICQLYGLIATSPLDPLPGEAADATGAADPYRIAQRNEAHIRHCDAIIANITPFRGPGADPGTAFEIGFGCALGKPVFAYATVSADQATRVRDLPGSSGRHDAEGLEIEDFGLFENLMLSCGITAGGGFVLAEQAACRWADLSVFERCVGRAAQALGAQPSDPAIAGAGRRMIASMTSIAGNAAKIVTP